MKEYTVLSFLSIALTFYLGRVMRAGIFRQGVYYIYLLVIFLFKLLVNGFLTGRPIVLYNSRFFLGLRIGSIPLEDFFFGFSMVTLTIIFWEYFKAKFPVYRR
jgi:lycopene cyclase domain-containing protein